MVIARGSCFGSHTAEDSASSAASTLIVVFTFLLVSIALVEVAVGAGSRNSATSLSSTAHKDWDGAIRAEVALPSLSFLFGLDFEEFRTILFLLVCLQSQCQE